MFAFLCRPEERSTKAIFQVWNKPLATQMQNIDVFLLGIYSLLMFAFEPFLGHLSESYKHTGAL